MSTEEAPRLTAEVLAAAYAEARRCYPEEACGLLLGPAEAPLCDEVRVCQNQQNALHQRDPRTFPRDARTAYALGAADLRLLDASLSGARPVKVVFHSHVEVGAYFSEEDQRAALFEGEPVYPVDYLVIDCAAAGVRGAKLFRFVDGGFQEIAAYAGQAAGPA